MCQIKNGLYTSYKLLLLLFVYEEGIIFQLKRNNI